MKRTRIKAKYLSKVLNGVYSINFSKKDKVEIWEDKEKELRLYVVNDLISFFYNEDKLVPTLKLLQENSGLLKRMVVDMGAVKFVVSGADIMRPGIVSFSEDIYAGDFVVIVDENHQKPLAVGISKNSSEELCAIDKGKVVKNIHFIGDDLWKLS
tara:strand:- start:52 stop:516 length:465 start_codon:yes stop_codon:yes gene_type:complete